LERSAPREFGAHPLQVGRLLEVSEPELIIDAERAESPKSALQPLMSGRATRRELFQYCAAGGLRLVGPIEGQRLSAGAV
jgi:hypothetical protein